MELYLKRQTRSNLSTIGRLFVDKKAVCYILEDKDRGLRNTMSNEEIAKLKVHGKTAIPSGKYEVKITYSNRFKRYLPEVINVPGYAGIRIHPGNTSEDTEGCLLPGVTTGVDMIGRSKEAFNILFPLLDQALKTGKVFIEIE